MQRQPDFGSKKYVEASPEEVAAYRERERRRLGLTSDTAEGRSNKFSNEYGAVGDGNRTHSEFQTNKKQRLAKTRKQNSEARKVARQSVKGPSIPGPYLGMGGSVALLLSLYLAFIVQIETVPQFLAFLVTLSVGLGAICSQFPGDAEVKIGRFIKATGIIAVVILFLYWIINGFDLNKNAFILSIGSSFS